MELWKAPGWFVLLGPEGAMMYERLYGLLERGTSPNLTADEAHNVIDDVVSQGVSLDVALANRGTAMVSRYDHTAEYIIGQLRVKYANLSEEQLEFEAQRALQSVAYSVYRWVPLAMWPDGRTRQYFILADATLLEVVPVEYGERPLEWFMKVLFVPTTMLASRLITSYYGFIRTGPGTRRVPFLFVTVTDTSGAEKTYKIDIGFIQSDRQWAAIMEAEYGSRFLEGASVSGITEVLLRPEGSITRLTYRAAFMEYVPRQIRTRRVGFFPLMQMVPGLDLSRYQVFSPEQIANPRPDMMKHCLLWALECSGVDMDTVRSLGSYIPGRSVVLTHMDEFFKKAHLRVRVEYATRLGKAKLTMGDLENPEHDVGLGVIENHVFINELTSISLLYLKHCWDLPPNSIGHTNIASFNHGIPDRYYDAPLTSSFDVINYLYRSKDGLLRGMGYYEAAAAFRQTMLQEEMEIEELSYDFRLSVRAISRETKDKEERPKPEIWFADYETFVVGPSLDDMKHKPFLLCYGKRNEPVKSLDVYTDHAKGVYTMLQDVGEGIVYFHNLNYDGTFLLDVLKPVRDSIIEYGGTKLLAFKVMFNGKMIEFRDSYAILPFALKKFPDMLGVDVEKEIMPYSFYCPSTYRARCKPEEAALNQPFTVEEFKSAAMRAGAYDGDEDVVDMWLYAEYYCKRDVVVLCEGYWRMDAMMEEATTQHIWERYTAPSLAFHSLRLKGVFEGCFELTGAPAFFIRKTVVGGRCMLRRNLKQRVETPIADFDAVSLYPSAMSELYTLKGTPKVIPPAYLEPAMWDTVRSGWDGYFIEIAITEVGRKLDFPLISYKGPEGRRFVNEVGNLWVDNITLEDLIEFQHIQYVPLRGYYFNEGKNMRIQEVIREIFDLRLKAKKEKKAIEQVYKLLMNSCYGKTIMKPRVTQKNVMTEENLVKELCGTPFTTVTFQNLSSGNYLVRTIVDVLKNWSFPTFGSQILSMSKRIMTRVMSLAQDLGIGVYYTDTDSIHIDRDAVPTLAEAYAATYHRELIGKNMGQFHTDFPCTERGMMWSRRFIGVGKKAYIDWLTDGTEEQYHIRLKGIPEISILNACEEAHITPLELYENFYRDDSYAMSFDLCDAKPMFSRKSDFTIYTLPVFYRRVTFSGAQERNEGEEAEELLEPVE